MERDPEFRDLSAYGITGRDQQEWHEVREGYRSIPPYPEALRDTTKSVVVLNMAEEYVKEYDKRILRTLVGKIDGIFMSGLHTDEVREAQKKFDDTYHDEASFDGRTFNFGRTRILHLPVDQYELTRKPTDYRDGRMRVQDTPAEDVVTLFDLETLEEDTEIIIIPPYQTVIDDYAKAIQDTYGKTPHIAFWTVTRFADSVGWRVAEYREGMPNLMGMEDGAL